VVAIWPGEREPEYNGKKLSEWLQICTRPSDDRWLQAEDAVRHIGTNGLPWLIKWMEYESPKWKGETASWKVWRILPRQLYRLVYSKEFQSLQAEEGFRILAPTSTQISAELACLLDEWPRKSSHRALMTVGHLGPAGLPILFKVATNRTALATLRCAALEEIGLVCAKERTKAEQNLSTNNIPLVPGLVRCLEEPEPNIRVAVTNALLKITPEVLMNGAKDF
jgi:hypothetical protein